MENFVNKNSKPTIVRFKARLYDDSSTGWTLLHIPDEYSKKLRGLTKVEGTINGQPFRTTLEANGTQLRVSKAMIKGANASIGDEATLAVLGPEPEIIPNDLKAALAKSHAASALWGDLSPLGRLDWIRWVNATKNPETRARRITRTVEQLAEGKRRACCVNVNEYMLCRLEEDELQAMDQNR